MEIEQKLKKYENQQFKKEKFIKILRESFPNINKLDDNNKEIIISIRKRTFIIEYEKRNDDNIFIVYCQYVPEALPLAKL